MGLWPTRGNESRAQEPRNRERRYLQEKKQVKPFFSTRLSGEPAGDEESRIALKTLGARSFAAAQDDSIETFFRGL